MLNLEQVSQIVTMVANSQLAEVEIRTHQQSIRVKNSPQKAGSAEFNHSPNVNNFSAPTSLAPSKPKQITSKYIGYVQLSADTVTPAFKNIGDSVAVGDTVAVVAQLGRLLPVESEQAGVIKEILIENNQRVEYGTPLFNLA